MSSLLGPLDRGSSPLRQFPDTSLRQVCRPLLEEDLPLVQDLGRRMIEIVDLAGALGVAAPQLGVGARLFAFRDDDGSMQVAVNPQVETAGDFCSDWEGCLSLGPTRLLVARPQHARMHAYDLAGEEFTVEASGMLARVLQHETDHLDGVLILDRSDQPLRSEELVWPWPSWAPQLSV